MAIKAKVEELVERIRSDKDILTKFQKDPVAVVENLIGMDLPDDQIEKLADMVKAKIDLDKMGDALGMPQTSSMFDSGLYGIPALSDDSGLNRVPRTMDKSAKHYADNRRGDTPSEPIGYMGQRIRFE